MIRVGASQIRASRHLLVFAVTGLVFSAVAFGCVSKRYFILPPVEPITKLVDKPLERRWFLKDVYVRPEPPTRSGILALLDASPRPQDWTKGTKQLEERLRQVLLGQPGLGQRVGRREDADFAVDLEVHVSEDEGLNPWAAAGLGVQIALTLGGAAAGALIADATGGDQQDVDNGFRIGLLAAVVPAGLIGALFPGSTRSGSIDGTLTVRRAADDVLAVRRRVQSAWQADMNVYFNDLKVAEASGRAVVEFEQRLVLVLQQALLQASASQGGIQGEDVNAENIRALWLAARYGHIETVRVLIGRGADVNMKDKDGWTALMGSAKEGHTEIMELLKQAGAR